MHLPVKAYYWIVGAIIAAFLFPNWRKLIGIGLFVIGFPAIVNLVRKDNDEPASLSGFALMIIGLILFCTAH